MAAAVLPSSSSASAQQQQCAACGTTLHDALMMECQHNLCVPCAARQLQATEASQRKYVWSLTCSICRIPTGLTQEAADTLRTTPVAVPPALAPSLAAPPPKYFPPPPPGNTSQALKNPLMSGGLPPQQPTHQSQQQLLQYQSSAAAGVAPLGAAARSVPVDATGTRMCPEHDQPLTYFCLACESAPMCSECVIRGDEHRGHMDKVVLIRKAYPEIRSRMDAMQSQVRSKVERLRHTEQGLIESTRQLAQVCQESRQSSQTAFQRLRQLLDRREAEVMGAISQMEETTKQGLNETLAEVQQRRSAVEGLGQQMAAVPHPADLGSKVPLEAVEMYVSLKKELERVVKRHSAVVFPEMVIDRRAAEKFASAVESLKDQIASLSASHTKQQQQQSMTREEMPSQAYPYDEPERAKKKKKKSVSRSRELSEERKNSYSSIPADAVVGRSVIENLYQNVDASRLAPSQDQAATYDESPQFGPAVF